MNGKDIGDLVSERSARAVDSRGPTVDLWLTRTKSQAKIIRRRRRLTAMVAVAMVAIGAAVVPSYVDFGDAVVGPARTNVGGLFPRHDAGRVLLGSVEFELPQHTGTVTVVPESFPISWTTYCVPGSLTVELSINGRAAEPQGCDPELGSTGSLSEQAWKELGLAVGEKTTFTLTATGLVDKLDGGGEPIKRPIPDTGTLALGVYEPER